ncbi:MAG: (Fe-S)-binding protein [Pseudomonadota bacterium]
MSIRQIIFLVLLIFAFGLFAWTISRFVRVMLRGRSFRGAFKNLGARIGDVFVYFLFQKSVAREKLSWHHLLIFWGFLIICVGSLEMFIEGVFPSFSYNNFIGPKAYGFFKGVLDITNGAVLVVMVYAFGRRIIVRPKLLPANFEALFILSLISLLCISHFLMYGFGVKVSSAMPISEAVAKWASGVQPSTAVIVVEVSYWLHISILFLFLNILPFSKHIHLLGALPNILTRNRGQHGVLPKLDLEDEDQWGVGRYEQFHWKSLLDTYACTECARCTNNCPAYNTDKPLSPMDLIHDIRYEMLERGPKLLSLTPGVKAGGGEEEEKSENAIQPTEADKTILKELEEKAPMVGGRIKDGTLWACTTCGTCEALCPVFIEHPEKIIQMRTHLVLSESRMPSELARIFKGMENNNNPWGIGADQRMDWAEGLDLPIMEEKKEAEYLVWIGCAGCYDDRGKKISRAWVQLLQKAGVDFALLGAEEGCTGDAARRAGNEFLFQMMAEANIEIFSQYKVKKILTTCPHCYHSFKHEYPQFGGEYEVWHHSEFINKLISEGKLTPQRKNTGKVTFHDPCYLGRWNHMYEEPRQVVAATCGGTRPLEMPRMGEKSFCCGAGGAHMWMEEEGERINVVRTKEALATGATTIATACPFCNVMITDGTKAMDRDEDVRVLDLAELVSESLE